MYVHESNETVLQKTIAEIVHKSKSRHWLFWRLQGTFHWKSSL